MRVRSIGKNQLPPNTPSCRLSIETAAKGLVTNYGDGGLEKREEGAREVLPLRKGGGSEKVLAMLFKGGHKTFWGSFYAVA